MSSNSETNALLQAIGINLLYHLPYMIICLVGVILAIAKWKTIKAAAPLTLIACLFAIVMHVCWTVTYPLLNFYQNSHHLSHSDFSWAYTTVGITTTILGCIPQIMWLIAIFVGRTPASPLASPNVYIR